MRFGAAVAGIKCTRIGGSAGAPNRAEVEAFLAQNRTVGPQPGAEAVSPTSPQRVG
jgi:hypothetical protein